MGVMTELTMNYVVNPFRNFWKTITFAIEMQGMARAARELQRLGYSKEAAQTLERMRQMAVDR